MTAPKTAILQIAQAIQGTEFEGKVYLAGGCVRDELLGRPLNDIDLCVELPEGGIKLARFLHRQKIGSAPVIYKQFGTALITVGGHKIELVMTRRESYRHHDRKPEVEFGTLQEDVLRRDFSINSLLQDISTGKVIDLSGQGRADLKAKLIRATSDPALIFREDPLRLLRAVRFATQLNFELESKTAIFIRKHACELQHISHERIAEETLKILMHPDYIRGLNLLAGTGLKRYVWPELRISRHLLHPLSQRRLNVESAWTVSSLTSLGIRERLVLVLWKSSDPQVYLKALKLAKPERQAVGKLLELCKNMRRLQKQGRLDTLEQQRLAADRFGALADELCRLYPLVRYLSTNGNSNYMIDVRLCRAIGKAAEELKGRIFPLTGHDIMANFNVKSGIIINRLLSEARKHWLKHPGADKAGLISHLKSFLANKRSIL